MGYFQGEQELFRSFEAQNGLNEGDILKAIRILDAQIADEERKQKSSDLAIASSQSVHPEVAAKFARLAGADVISGSQIKEAKPILQRMSKTLADPNLPEDVKQASLQKEQEDLDQITLRTTYQGGKKGVAVTGVTESGQRAANIGLVGEAKSGIGGTSRALLTPSGELPSAPELQGRFFPEPEKPAYQQETEQFMQTLEPESTVLGGTAGQQDIAQKKARNDLRKKTFLARGKKEVATPKTIEEVIARGLINRGTTIDEAVKTLQQVKAASPSIVVAEKRIKGGKELEQLKQKGKIALAEKRAVREERLARIKADANTAIAKIKAEAPGRISQILADPRKLKIQTERLVLDWALQNGLDYDDQEVKDYRETLMKEFKNNQPITLDPSKYMR